jgi:hypothetical protein
MAVSNTDANRAVQAASASIEKAERSEASIVPAQTSPVAKQKKRRHDLKESQATPRHCGD